MSTNLRKQRLKLWKKNEKKNPGPILVQDRPQNNSSKCFVRSGKIPSPGQTSIDINNDCAMKSERGAPVRGSDPPSGHSVHKTTGDGWRAPARPLIQTFGRCCVENRPQKFSQKIGLFSGLGEERRTPQATSRPLDHGSTWYLRGRHLHSPALPETNRVGRGLLLCRNRTPIVAWAVFDQRVGNFQRESPSSNAYKYSSWTSNPRKTNIFFLCSP